MASAQEATGYRLTEAETIALRYHQAARGDAWAALVQAIEDALATLPRPSAGLCGGIERHPDRLHRRPLAGI